jgi:hypothetical protein
MNAHKIQIVTLLGHRYDIECECTRCVAIHAHQRLVRRQRRKALVAAVLRTAARKQLFAAYERLRAENPQHSKVIADLYWEAQRKLG